MSSLNFACRISHNNIDYTFHYISSYKCIEIILNSIGDRAFAKIRYKKFRPSIKKSKFSKILEGLIKNISKNTNCEIDNVSLNNICKLIEDKDLLDKIDIEWKQHNVSIFNDKIKKMERIIDKLKNNLSKIESW